LHTFRTTAATILDKAALSAHVCLARRAAGDTAALALDSALRDDAPEGAKAWQKDGIGRKDDEASGQDGL
jgi:hypothetical protein